MLDDKGVITDQDELTNMNKDYMRKYIGKSQLALRPKNTEEVSEILKYCNERKLAVVPQGGITGLVGGSVPSFDEVIVNLGRMDKILGFDPMTGIVSSEAGCILSNLQDYTSQYGYEMPYNLGSRGSCMVGGNLSTNVGGVKLMRNNSLHANCIGMKTVLADGTILDNMNLPRKDNTGYHLKHLFIGAEGTLGVITECSLLCYPIEQNRSLAMLACDSIEKVTSVLTLAKRSLGRNLSAFELLDQ